MAICVLCALVTEASLHICKLVLVLSKNFFVCLVFIFQQKGKRRSTDLRALAEGWGCKVLSLNELLKELRKLKPLPKKESPSKKAPVVKGNNNNII